jgi:SAM-dependent methyltransferase
MRIEIAVVRESGTAHRMASVGLEGIRRLNWGCGDWVEPGWINSDIKEGQDVLTCDIRQGFPLESNSIDYAVSIHALPELHYAEQLGALGELRRVLKPGGTLRLGLPDLERAVDAYRRGDRRYFVVSDDEMASLGGKLITQLVWFGYSRTLFVRDFIEELLLKAEFREVHHIGYKETQSGYPDIVALDNREAESLFVEAVK